MDNRDTNYTWKGQLAVGKAGEDVVMNWLRYTLGRDVIDVRRDPRYQAGDIDLILVDGYNNVNAEVKTDTYDNQYVFFETHTAENTPGALFKSRADLWYIYKPALGKIIAVDPARVATHIWINDRTVGAPRFKVYPVFNDKRRIRAWGVKLPIRVLEHLGGVVYLLPETDSVPEPDA